ncbi:MAG: hypothetical protein KY396_01565 [Actinobacteria bacterium]|nr:hypothetical protein [Actinomycetota bacterium]
MVLRALAAVVIALVLVPAASAAPPSNLRGFLLGASEAQSDPHSFSRTPAFAWNRVAGASRYEFELATSRTFADNALVWKKTKIKGPLTNVPLTLPWIGNGSTGYAWYARVRAVVNGKKTGWSDRYGFNMAPASAPTSLSSGGVNPQPGMVRWTPVAGATAYEVLFVYGLDSGRTKLIKTATTAADLREFYTLHNDTSTWPDPVTWRVRAVRELEGKPLNHIPVSSHGKWSATNVTNEPPLAATAVDLAGTISRSGSSDVAATTSAGGVHSLAPGFWWSGSLSVGDLYGACPANVDALGVTCPLFHVYVYTDADCVNRVHSSDLVGSPAYVPRISGVLGLPGDDTGLAEAAVSYLGDAPGEGSVFDAAGEAVYAAGLDPNLPATTSDDRRSGFWDIDWTSTGYFWTVVPSIPRLGADGSVVYQDVAFGQDHCAAGEVLPFSKMSEPVTEKASGVPYVSGQTSNGVRSATSSTPAFYGPRIVVAWRPAPGARRYQVQWSRKAYPFDVVGSKRVIGTQAPLALRDGTWYYRVRGIDTTIPGTAQGMTWSDPQYVKILPRTFFVS